MKTSANSKKVSLRLLLPCLLFLGFLNPLMASPLLQKQDSIINFKEYKGIVVDSNSKVPLAFATLSIAETNISTVTNSDGQFSLKVPKKLENNNITVSFLGYKVKQIPLSSLNGDDITILLEEVALQLSEVTISAPKDAVSLVKAVLDKKAEHYLDEETRMTAFYRETIKKRRRDASLSEAIVEIYRQPYTSNKTDKIRLIKARKNTNYERLDTLAFKLQGGPYSALYADIIKYPQYIFTKNNLSDFDFKFDKSTEINNRSVYVVSFQAKKEITDPMHYGKLYIDAESQSLISAVYSLNVENRELAAKMFVKKKPNRAQVYPTAASYRVDYRLKDDKWYYGYSSIQLTFKVNWKGRLFNSVYTLNSEMAITDWEKDMDMNLARKDMLRPSVILSEQASGFSDPRFWGEYNIIEPEKSIESAIEKINKHLKKRKGNDQ